MKKIKTIHLALLAFQLLAGCLVLGLAAYYQQQEGTSIGFVVFGPLWSLTTILIAMILNRMRHKQASSFTHPERKIQHYRSTVLLRCAIVESGNLFVLLFLFLDAFNLIYIGCFLLGLCAFFYYRPSEKEFESW